MSFSQMAILFSLVLVQFISIGPHSKKVQKASRTYASDDITLPGGLTVSNKQLDELREKLPKLQKEKKFFHWTTEENGMRWSAQGHVDDGEVRFLNTPTGSKQVYGAGIYLAESHTSSKNYGVFPVTFILNKGTPIYDDQIVSSVLGKQLSKDQISALGEHVHYARNVSGDWWLTHSSTNTTRVEPGFAHGAPYKGMEDLKSLNGLYRNLKKSKDIIPGAEWLTSFYHLTYYMDGISLLRAIQVNPNSPWQEFEPEHFDKFRAVREEYLDQGPSSGSLHWGSENHLNKKEWAQKTINNKIKDIHSKLSGTDETNFRGHSVRAGGAQENNSFMTTPNGLKNLLENEYLEVRHQKMDDGIHFLVSYEYPDISNWKKLQNKLSSSLISKLEALTPDEITNRTGQASALNQEFIEELMQNMLTKLHSKKISPAAFLSEFISIHPFSDSNGRTSRVFLESELIKRGRELPPMFMSDLDLLVNEETFEQVIEDSKKSYIALYKDFMGEFISKGLKKELQRYYELPGWKKLFKSLEVFGMGEAILEPIHYQDVYERKFSTIMQSKLGDAWDLSLKNEVDELITFSKEQGANQYADAIILKISNSIDQLAQNNYDVTAISNIGNFLENVKNIEGVKEIKEKFSNFLETEIENIPDTDPGKLIIYINHIKIKGPEERRSFIEKSIVPYFEEPSRKNNNQFYYFLKELNRQIEYEQELNNLVDGKIDIDTFFELYNTGRKLSPPWDLAFLDLKKLKQVYPKFNSEQRYQFLRSLEWEGATDPQKGVEIIKLMTVEIKADSPQKINLTRIVKNGLNAFLGMRPNEPDEFYINVIDEFLDVDPDNLKLNVSTIQSISFGNEVTKTYLYSKLFNLISSQLSSNSEETITDIYTILQDRSISQHFINNFSHEKLFTFLNNLSETRIEKMITSHERFFSQPLFEAVLKLQSTSKYTERIQKALQSTVMLKIKKEISQGTSSTDIYDFISKIKTGLSLENQLVFFLKISLIKLDDSLNSSLKNDIWEALFLATQEDSLGRTTKRNYKQLFEFCIQGLSIKEIIDLPNSMTIMKALPYKSRSSIEKFLTPFPNSSVEELKTTKKLLLELAEEGTEQRYVEKTYIEQLERSLRSSKTPTDLSKEVNEFHANELLFNSHSKLKDRFSSLVKMRSKQYLDDNFTNSLSTRLISEMIDSAKEETTRTFVYNEHSIPELERAKLTNDQITKLKVWTEKLSDNQFTDLIRNLPFEKLNADLYSLISELSIKRTDETRMNISKNILKNIVFGHSSGGPKSPKKLQQIALYVFSLNNHNERNALLDYIENNIPNRVYNKNDILKFIRNSDFKDKASCRDLVSILVKTETF